MRNVTLECTSCGCTFEKAKKEVDRQRKKGREHFYCSLTCSGKESVNHLNTPERMSDPNRHIPVRTKDEYSDFREFIRRAKRREKLADIDVVYLKELWDTQNGLCTITWVPLSFTTKNPNYMVSLDRIDSGKPYAKGNVRFVSLTVNHLKNKYPDDTIFEFFAIVRTSPPFIMSL